MTQSVDKIMIKELTKERDALALDVDQWRVDFHELHLEYNALAALHTDAAMQAYGQQCREAALMDAATMLFDASSRMAACPFSAENETAKSTLIYQSHKIRSLK